MLLVAIAAAIAWKARSREGPNLAFLDCYQARELNVVRVGAPYVMAPGGAFRLFAFPTKNYQDVMNRIAVEVVPQAVRSPAYARSSAAMLQARTDQEGVIVDAHAWRVQLYSSKQTMNEAKHWTNDAVTPAETLCLINYKPPQPRTLADWFKALLHI